MFPANISFLTGKLLQEHLQITATCWWFRIPSITSWGCKYFIPMIYKVLDILSVVGNGMSEPSTSKGATRRDPNPASKITHFSRHSSPSALGIQATNRDARWVPCARRPMHGPLHCSIVPSARDLDANCPIHAAPGSNHNNNKTT